MADGKSETKQQEQALAPRTRALAPVPLHAGVLTPTNLSEAIEVAKLIAHSGLVPKQYDGNPGAVLIAIQMGAELGLSPMSAIQNIAVINGRPSLWGDAMLALVVAHRDCEDVVEDLDEKAMVATCTVKRRDRSPIVRRFSQEDAKTAGLWGKQGPWQQYPKRMLQMRARGFALRDAFPDALRGIVSAEEAGDHRAIDMGAAVFADAREPSEPQPGVMKFGGKKSTPAAAKPSEPQPGVMKFGGKKSTPAAAKPVEPEPEHDADGVVTEPAKAEAKPTAPPAGQTNLAGF